MALLKEAAQVQVDISDKKNKVHHQKLELNHLEQRVRELMAQEECLMRTKESISEGLKRLDATLKPKILVSWLLLTNSLIILGCQRIFRESKRRKTKSKAHRGQNSC